MKKIKLLLLKKKTQYHYFIVFYNYIEYIIMLQNSLLYKCIIFELKQNELF